MAIEQQCRNLKQKEKRSQLCPLNMALREKGCEIGILRRWCSSVCRAGFPRGPDGRMLPSQQGGRTGVWALSAQCSSVGSQIIDYRHLPV